MGAGVVQSWAAMVMGMVAGSIPWFTMMILHKKSALLQKVIIIPYRLDLEVLS